MHKYRDDSFAFLLAVQQAILHVHARTNGDGTMHVARKILVDAINAYDQAIAKDRV